MCAVFTAGLHAAFPCCDPAKGTDAAVHVAEAAITKASDPRFGHFQCNSAMGVFKKLKSSPLAGSASAASPQTVARAIIECLPDTRLFDKTEVAGPGFINAHLSTRFAYGARYYVCAEAIDADELIRRERTARGGRVLVGDEE